MRLESATGRAVTTRGARTIFGGLGLRPVPGPGRAPAIAARAGHPPLPKHLGKHTCRLAVAARLPQRGSKGLGRRGLA